jgi:predicted HTH domain antitoxin
MNLEDAMTRRATIPYPDELPETLALREDELPAELAFLAAAKLYELGRLSSGQAARLAGADRVTFLHRLAEVGVPAINLRDEEIEAEVQAARDLAG